MLSLSCGEQPSACTASDKSISATPHRAAERSGFFYSRFTIHAPCGDCKAGFDCASSGVAVGTLHSRSRRHRAVLAATTTTANIGTTGLGVSRLTKLSSRRTNLPGNRVLPMLCQQRHGPRSAHSGGRQSKSPNVCQSVPVKLIRHLAVSNL